MYKVPKQNPPSLFRIEPFLGLDYSTTESQINDHNSPDMLNFNIDERGSLTKRVGYRKVNPNSFGTGQINGIFSFDNNGTQEILIAHGTQIYRMEV